jgi:3-hydroxyacyl-CoA dehydrogenase/enoyl-CoA hydratase/3-hydroxybutyryl-CoA epimerase
MAHPNKENSTAVGADYLNWRIDIDANDIAWLCLDKPDASANVLSRDVLTEFAEIVVAMTQTPPAGLIIYSGKSSGFIAGADINIFPTIESEQQAYDLMRLSHKILADFVALPCTTVAMIDGFALGGGLELALACDARVVAETTRPILGFPEVQLGLHPGFGGTVRSVRLIGVMRAMPLMLTGKSVRPDKALSLGLVDEVVSPESLRQAARALALKSPPERRRSILDRLLHIPFMRSIVAARMHSSVAKRANREQYPAPFALVDLWQRYGAQEESAYDAEARSFARLIETDTSRNLVRVYFLQERLKRTAARDDSVDAGNRGCIHVVGAGVMGGDIAAWCALRGFSVTLQDREMKYIQPALDRAAKLFEKRFRDPEELAAARGRLRADTSGEGVSQADVVIEAIFEDSEAKRALYQQLEPRMKADAILATNTSSIPLEELAPSLQKPERLIGLHFFNPVAKLPLVEVVIATSSSAEVVAKGLSLTRQIGKLPLPCRSLPGFLVNRILGSYMAEALEMVGEGVPLADIDQAAVDFGMPMGPIELMDSVGIDVALHVAKILAPLAGRKVAPELEELVAAGRLGKKSGQGFYLYSDNKPVRPPATREPIDNDTQDRLILAFINEAMACLADKVVEDEELIDAGVIFGTGFAPFRGGPIHYARTVGVDAMMANLNELADRYGERFTPTGGWAELRQ